MTSSGIRELTQKEWNSLSESQKPFFLELCHQGKCRIVKEKSDDKPPRMDFSQPLSNLAGKKVVMTLVNGDRMEGQVLEISKFEVVIQNQDGVHIVLKHSIMVIRELLV